MLNGLTTEAAQLKKHAHPLWWMWREVGSVIREGSMQSDVRDCSGMYVLFLFLYPIYPIKVIWEAYKSTKTCKKKTRFSLLAISLINFVLLPQNKHKSKASSLWSAIVNLHIAPWFSPSFWSQQKTKMVSNEWSSSHYLFNQLRGDSHLQITSWNHLLLCKCISKYCDKSSVSLIYHNTMFCTVIWSQKSSGFECCLWKQLTIW